MKKLKAEDINVSIIVMEAIQFLEVDLGPGRALFRTVIEKESGLNREQGHSLVDQTGTELTTLTKFEFLGDDLDAVLEAIHFFSIKNMAGADVFKSLRGDFEGTAIGIPLLEDVTLENCGKLFAAAGIDFAFPPSPEDILREATKAKNETKVESSIKSGAICLHNLVLGKVNVDLIFIEGKPHIEVKGDRGTALSIAVEPKDLGTALEHGYLFIYSKSGQLYRSVRKFDLNCEIVNKIDRALGDRNDRLIEGHFDSAVKETRSSSYGSSPTQANYPSVLDVLVDYQITTAISLSQDSPLLYVNAYTFGERSFTLKLGLVDVPKVKGWFSFKGRHYKPNLPLSGQSAGCLKLYKHLKDHGAIEFGKEPGKRDEPLKKKEVSDDSMLGKLRKSLPYLFGKVLVANLETYNDDFLLSVMAFEDGNLKLTLKLEVGEVQNLEQEWFKCEGKGYAPLGKFETDCLGVRNLKVHLKSRALHKAGKDPLAHEAAKVASHVRRITSIAPSLNTTGLFDDTRHLDFNRAAPTSDIGLGKVDFESIDRDIKDSKTAKSLEDEFEKAHKAFLSSISGGLADKKVTVNQKLIEAVPWLKEHPKLVWLEDLSSLDVKRVAVEVVNPGDDENYVLLLMQMADDGIVEVFQTPLSVSYVPNVAYTGGHFLIFVDGCFFESESFIGEYEAFQSLHCLSRLRRKGYSETDTYEVRWEHE